jgi:hypothetical protein
MLNLPEESKKLNTVKGKGHWPLPLTEKKPYKKNVMAILGTKISNL